MSRRLVALVVILLPWIAYLPAAGAERLPVPNKAAIEKAQRLLQEVYEDSLSSRDSARRLELSRTMLAQAAELDGDPAGKYVLLTQARDLAAEAGDVSAGMAAAEELIKTFAVGSAETKLAGLPAASKAKDVPALAEALIDISNEALAEEDFPVAGKAASMAASAARRARGDKALVARARAQPAVVARARKSAEAAAQAKAMLGADPDDPAANTTLGRYLCFERGDWAAGVLHLAKSDDALLKALANRELRLPEDGKAMTALAEAWWDLPDGRGGVTSAQARSRAATWYRRALPKLTGLRKAAAEQRIAEATAPVGWRPRLVNLMPLIDPTKDTVAGTWTLENGTLRCASTDGARIEIPYRPPAEYDLRVILARRSGGNAIVHLLARGDDTFEWVAGFENGGDHAWGFVLDGANRRTGPADFHTGKVYATVVQVRAGSVIGYVDGKKVVEVKTDLRGAKHTPLWDLRDQTLLGLGAWSTVAEFRKIEVLEISGPGTRTRSESPPTVK